MKTYKNNLIFVAYLFTASAYAVPVFSPYKDTVINYDWNTNVINSAASGVTRDISTDLKSRGASTITLAFANGVCGSETWSGATGATVASVNKPKLVANAVNYIVATGGAGGIFTCGTNANMTTFLNRWNSAYFKGVDFDIESGQTTTVINNLVQRVKAAHATAAFAKLTFSFTLATSAVNQGATVAVPNLGTGKGKLDPYSGLSVDGKNVMAAIKTYLGWTGTAATWPSYVKINLMTMDYGTPPSMWVCVVSGGKCQMGQSALQAAYNLASAWNVPFSAIEVTPMIGGNDVTDEQFTLADVDTVSSFAIMNGLAGVHYWSYDRDVPCAVGAAQPTCNTMGTTTQRYDYINRFILDGLR